MDDEAPTEEVLFEAPEAFAYQIAKLGTLAQARAAEWGLADPFATVGVRLVSRGTAMAVQMLQLAASGTPPVLAPVAAGMIPGMATPPKAQHSAASAESPPPAKRSILAICVVDLQYGPDASTNAHNKLQFWIEETNDSSRYFRLRVRRKSGTTLLGLGFRDRSVASAFRSALHSHITRCKRHATPLDLPDAAAVLGKPSAAAGMDATESAAASSAAGSFRLGVDERVTVRTAKSPAAATGTGTAAAAAGSGRKKPGHSPSARLGAPRSASGSSHSLKPPRSAAKPGLNSEATAPVQAEPKKDDHDDDDDDDFGDFA
jgi:hypothetical protein